MKKVVITGATGNVGIEVIKSLSLLKHDLYVVAGVRNVEKNKEKLEAFKARVERFDFMAEDQNYPALKNCHTLFLLRPPQISDVNKYFKPIIDAAKKENVQHIIFLSVQGVQNSKVIPHHKIEKLIVDSGIAYSFLRPAYFLQNFTTTLRNDLISRNEIFLPAGKAKFTLIDVEDIGAVAAKIITMPDDHLNKAYDLTNNEKLSFEEMVQQLSEGLKRKIRYISPTLVRFFFRKRQENVPVPFILVMIMLHYLPRFQKEPPLSDWVKMITGKEPKTFKEFIEANKTLLLKASLKIFSGYS